MTMEKLYSRGSVAISPDLEYLVNDVKKMNFLLNIVSCYDSDYCLMLTNMLATEKGNEQYICWIWKVKSHCVQQGGQTIWNVYWR